MVHRLPRGLPLAVLLIAALTVLMFTQGAFGTSSGKSSDPKPMIVTMLPQEPVVEPASRSRTPVAKLGSLVVPDLLIALPSGVTAAQVSSLRSIRGMKTVTVVSTGAVTVDGKRHEAMGVDPSAFRAFTPRETATSDALWAAVARGELASSYTARLPLSTNVDVNGQSLRVGALASFGLPSSDVVVGQTMAASLGLQPNAVLVSAPERKLRNLKRDVRSLLGAKVEMQSLRPVEITYRRPSSYKDLYVLSAQYCPGLSWKVLAAIGQVESGHGRNIGPSTAGALGPMQFLPTTWAEAGVDGDGDGKADIMSPYDAVPAAALYLCRNGAARGEQGLYNAIFSYNHADWYVKKVLDLAARY